jgi:hypothetical protein
VCVNDRVRSDNVEAMSAMVIGRHWAPALQIAALRRKANVRLSLEAIVADG